jgi:acyl-CoA synthetase (AMP-forming)/AMP-acid ligase II
MNLSQETVMKAFVVAALATLWAGAVFAQTPAATASERVAHHMDNLAILLDLTAAQKAQVQTILQEQHTQMRQALQDVKASTAAGTGPNWQQMRTLHQQISEETITKLTPVLSATQLQKFKILQHAMMHGHLRHHGGGGAADAPVAATH